MKVKEIISAIEHVAPKVYQESYDNAGLIIGNEEMEIKAVLLCLDCTEAIIDEAIAKGCNMVIAHHPLIFKGLKRINGNNNVERTVIKAIQNSIAVYAAHTNLDNVLNKGVSQKFAQKLGLQDLKILQTKSGNLVKIIVYTPEKDADTIKETLFSGGAGSIGLYSECSFTIRGQGSFKPGENANPSIGKLGEREVLDELRIEAIAPAHLAEKIIKDMKKVHQYEEMAYEIIPLANHQEDLGSGVVGILEKDMDAEDFLALLKEKFNLEVIKYTPKKGKVRKVAVCGGSGSFLLGSAIKAGVDAYVTADVKYHEFFEAPDTLMFCDIGHYESEIYTLELFYEVIQEKFPTFAVRFCETSTNPIHYHK